jgi:hypothetical protein
MGGRKAIAGGELCVCRHGFKQNGNNSYTRKILQDFPE